MIFDILDKYLAKLYNILKYYFHNFRIYTAYVSIKTFFFTCYHILSKTKILSIFF